MPRVATEIPETYENIVRPVAMEIARQVAKLTNIPLDVNILFAGSTEQAPQQGSTLDDDGSDPSSFKYTQRFRVEVSEQAVEDRVLTTAVMQKENPPIFLDRDLGVLVKPVYSGTEMTISLTYRAEDRVTARRFRDDMLMRTSQLRAENLHEITYHYQMPYVYLHLLKEIHRLRENVDGYGEDFSAYVRKYITPRATNLTTLIGTQPQLTISETQVCPWGYFSDFIAQPPTEEKDREGGTYNVTFEYRFIYDKIIGCVAEWPLVVHNQLIPEPWREKPNASGHLIDPARRLRAPTISRHAFDYFTNLYPSQCKRKVDGVVMPEFDDWEPATVHPDTSTVATIMLMVDPDDPNAVLNLKELGDYDIDPVILEFLRGEAPYLNRFGESIVYLSLYRGNRPIDDGSLMIDRNLNVRTNLPQKLRERYHLRIALTTDLFSLDNNAIERLRTAGPACIKILSTLQWKLFGNAYVPKLLGGRVVSRQELMAIAQRINDLKAPHQSGLEYRMLTVGNFLITAHRRNDYADHEAQTVGARPHGPDFGDGNLTPIPGCNG